MDLINRQDAIDAIIKRDANCRIDSAEVLIDKHLVMCNGYCAWAERKEE